MSFSTLNVTTLGAQPILLTNLFFFIMALNYIVRKGKDLKNSANVVYQGRVKIKDYKDTMSLAELISDQASATVADVYGVLASIVQVMKSYVMDGNIVELGDFGSFRATLQSKPVDNVEHWSGKVNLRGMDIVFSPGAQLRRAYALAQFKSAEEVPSQDEGESESGGQGGGQGGGEEIIPTPGE